MAESEQAKANKLAYIDRYQKENVKRVVVKFNQKTELELYQHVMSHPNVQGYIKSLIKADMEK